MTVPGRTFSCWLLATVFVTTVACGDSDQGDNSDGGVAGDIVVFAAASLTEAFTRIGEEFERAHPGAAVTFNFAASSELAAQISEGAPADVFASADLANMARLTASGSSVGEPVLIATNRAAIVVAAGNPLGIRTITDVADPDLVVIICAPQTPCGEYAVQLAANAGVTLLPDSYEENVKAVVTKVRLGEADAGVAYVTDIAAAGDDVDGIAVPDGENVVAEYPIAVTTESTNRLVAEAFVD